MPARDKSPSTCQLEQQQASRLNRASSLRDTDTLVRALPAHRHHSTAKSAADIQEQLLPPAATVRSDPSTSVADALDRATARSSSFATPADNSESKSAEDSEVQAPYASSEDGENAPQTVSECAASDEAFVTIRLRPEEIKQLRVKMEKSVSLQNALEIRRKGIQEREKFLTNLLERNSFSVKERKQLVDCVKKVREIEAEVATLQQQRDNSHEELLTFLVGHGPDLEEDQVAIPFIPQDETQSVSQQRPESRSHTEISSPAPSFGTYNYRPLLGLERVQSNPASASSQIEDYAETFQQPGPPHQPSQFLGSSQQSRFTETERMKNYEYWTAWMRKTERRWSPYRERSRQLEEYICLKINNSRRLFVPHLTNLMEYKKKEMQFIQKIEQLDRQRSEYSGMATPAPEHFETSASEPGDVTRGD